jgi:hypothetical protein
MQSACSVNVFHFIALSMLLLDNELQTVHRLRATKGESTLAMVVRHRHLLSLVIVRDTTAFKKWSQETCMTLCDLY